MAKYKKYYTIYRINEKNNDLEYIREYTNIEQLKKDYNISNNTNISKYIAKTAETIKEKLQNSYVIFKEKEEV